jgi:hypothetical protein
MTEFYSNLPQKLRDNLQKTADSLVDNNYKERFEFAQNDLDATVGFFVKRGFAQTASRRYCLHNSTTGQD